MGSRQSVREGIHFIVPIVNTVQTLSVRVQNQEISAEASSKDLQDVYTDVALNWHIIPEETGTTLRSIFLCLPAPLGKVYWWFS
ncbi:MAG TPA: SPFH domain-containing protein [Thermosynechococcaceae cyanobacterium]